MAFDVTNSILLATSVLHLGKCATVTWTKQTDPPMPAACANLAIGYSSSTKIIWLIGGSDAINGFALFPSQTSFDPIYNTFTSYSSLTAIANLTSWGQSYTQIDDTIYMVHKGAFSTFSMSTRISTQSWNSVTIPNLHADHLDEFNGCLASVANRYLIVLGGVNDYNLLAVRIYDALNHEWSIASDMIRARKLFSCSVHNDYLYAIGGVLNTGSITATVEKLYVGDISNVHNEQWIETHSLSVPVASSRSIVVNDDIFVIGGTTTSDQPSSAVQVIDTANNDATSTNAPLPDALSSAAAVFVDARVYVFGGNDGLADDYATEWWYISDTVPTQTPTTSPSMSSSDTSNALGASAVFGIVTGILFLLTVIVCIARYLQRRKERKVHDRSISNLQYTVEQTNTSNKSKSEEVRGEAPITFDSVPVTLTANRAANVVPYIDTNTDITPVPSVVFHGKPAPHRPLPAVLHIVDEEKMHRLPPTNSGNGPGPLPVSFESVKIGDQDTGDNVSVHIGAMGNQQFNLIRGGTMNSAYDKHRNSNADSVLSQPVHGVQPRSADEDDDDFPRFNVFDSNAASDVDDTPHLKASTQSRSGGRSNPFKKAGANMHAYQNSDAHSVYNYHETNKGDQESTTGSSRSFTSAARKAQQIRYRNNSDAMSVMSESDASTPRPNEAGRHNYDQSELVTINEDSD